MITREKLDDITHSIIGAAYQVHGSLAPGFVEKVYENALTLELAEGGLAIEQQRQVEVIYRGRVVGNYVADLIVDGAVLVEVKAVDVISAVHRAQCINYLRALDLPVCLLLNFGARSLDLRRIVHRF
jgi:GxxExxY protein